MLIGGFCIDLLVQSLFLVKKIDLIIFWDGAERLDVFENG
jgi:hypothetical protein